MEWYTAAAQEFNKKYYFASKHISATDWEVELVTNSKDVVENKFMDSLPFGEWGNYEFAIFRIKQWEARRPLVYIDYRDHSNTPIKTSVGMMTINQAHSGLF